LNAAKWDLEFGKPNEIKAKPEKDVVLIVTLRRRKPGQVSYWTSSLLVEGECVHYSDKAELSSEAKKNAEKFYARWCER
jgi:hypothetical protein